MRTRCPDCSTVFRVTTEQLRLRAGKVRCGNCQTVFNAFDALVSEAHEPLIETPPSTEPTLEEVSISPVLEEPQVVEQNEEAPLFPREAPQLQWPDDLPFEEPVRDVADNLPDEAPELPADVATVAFPPLDVDAAQSLEPVPVVPEVEIIEIVLPELGAPEPVEAELPVSAPVPPEPLAPEPVTPEPLATEPIEPEAEAEPIQVPLPEPLVESPEETTEAARQAGLVASRELNEAAAFNRWSAGTLASDGLGGFEVEEPKRAVWPFVFVAILLLIGLIGQLMFYYRTEIVLRFPGVASLYSMVSVDIPLPRNAALVSIETSDLQFDNVRGLFVLQATLKNRALYPQAWPALELSLTDINDSVVSRRVLYAADYLPLGTTASSFQANGDMPVQLWVEAKESGASGYRLYIFYP